MSAFTNLNDALRAMKTDPSTARDPIKCMFLCDGQFITANASIIEDSGNALHTRPSHDEIVLILGGYQSRDLILLSTETLHLVSGIRRSVTLRGPKRTVYLSSELDLIYGPSRTPAFLFADS